MSLINLILKSYPSPAYTVVTEVANATGGSKCRSADAIAVGCWPSRGMTITGFECKSSRQDWLRELKNPAKADPCQKYCDYWFLVTASTDIADIHEIPESWGWLAAKGGRLKTMKAAKQLSPVPVDRGFLASLMRNNGKKSGVAAAVEQARREGFIEAYNKGKEHAERMSSTESKMYRNLRDSVEKFEKATGLSVEYQWNLPSVAEAVKAMMAGSPADNLKRIMESYQGYVESIKETLEKLVKLDAK